MKILWTQKAFKYLFSKDQHGRLLNIKLNVF